MNTVSHPEKNVKFCHQRNQAPVFAIVHKQPFPLLHCCLIGNLKL